MRRKLPGDAPASASADGGSAPSEADLAQLSTAISAEEDLGLFVRWAFACGRPEPLLSSLRAVAQDREAEIEELCRAHYGLGGHGGGGRHSMLPTARRAGCHYGLEEFRGWSAFLSATAADPASPNCPSSPPSFTPMSSLPLPSSLIVPHKDGSSLWIWPKKKLSLDLANGRRLTNSTVPASHHEAEDGDGGEGDPVMEDEWLPPLRRQYPRRPSCNSSAHRRHRKRLAEVARVMMAHPKQHQTKCPRSSHSRSEGRRWGWRLEDLFLWFVCK